MKKILFISLFFVFIFQSCGPIVGTVGMVSLGAAAKEKGIGTTISDNLIRTKISNLLFKWKPEILSNTKIFVNNGSVLITGKLKKTNDKIEFTKIAWKIRGVNEVNNELQITDTSNIKNIARDLASISEIRARLISSKNINSINYSIDVVNDIAYLSGIASNKEEMMLVKSHASSARFVSDVYNYIILSDDTR